MVGGILSVCSGVLSVKDNDLLGICRWEKGARTYDEGVVGPLRCDRSQCKFYERQHFLLIPLVVYICIYIISRIMDI